MSKSQEFPDLEEVIAWVEAKPDDWTSSVTHVET